ncbi:MAG: ImmA/IrrE family metallo-endopeptidase [candidate division WOR-3 bacterium]
MRAEDYARKLFRLIDIMKIPIDLTPILKAYNIEVQEESFANLLGVTFKTKNFNLIVINKNLPARQKFFTLAHEIAHIVMPHKGTTNICQIGKNKLMEQSANRFAAELLMPYPTLKKLWDEYKSNPEYRISILADMFGVSYEAMKTRIKTLGLC